MAAVGDTDMQTQYVAISRFLVGNAMEAEVRQAFLDRPHLVDSAPGFVKMEVLCGAEDAREFLLMTWWTDEDAYRTWHRGHTYRASHQGIPTGLKLVKGSASVSGYWSVAT